MSAAPVREPAMTAPLRVRIRAMERQLAGRQSAVRSHAVALGRGARASLGSPAALLAGVGAGFALGLFTKRDRSRPRSPPPPAPVEATAARPSIFASLLDAVTLVTSVMALFPALGGGIGRGRDAGAPTGGDDY